MEGCHSGIPDCRYPEYPNVAPLWTAARTSGAHADAGTGTAKDGLSSILSVPVVVSFHDSKKKLMHWNSRLLEGSMGTVVGRLP